MKNYLGKQIFQSAFYPTLFLIVVWIVFALQSTFNHRLIEFGILPRQAIGLIGIITSVFIHGDFNHIISNSFPLLILGMMLFYFYKKIAKQAFLWIWLISGIWLWVGGRNNDLHPNYHIGASTLIYGLATFLFFSGVFRKHLRLMVVSALVVFLYGSMVWGMFPIKTEISWEGHLFGAIAGILVAFNYRKEGPQRQIYQWEEEEEDANENIEIVVEEDSPNADEHQQEIKINFIYKEKKKEE